MKRSFLFFLLILVFFSCTFFSCATIKNDVASEKEIENFSEPEPSKENETFLEYEPIEKNETTEEKTIEKQPLFYPDVRNPIPNSLTLIFAGDIMAHTPNYSMSDYSKIWSDIKDVTSDSDFTFGNIEMPVCETLPKSSYPSFNVHQDYVQAAIDSGFNVFSLCNNHSNDQYLEGLKASKKFGEETETRYKDSERKVYFAGLKDGEKAEFTYNIIEKDGWKILFVPITQLLNRPDYSSYVNFLPSKKDKKDEFLKWCKDLREKNPCDLFILSLHTNEEEYIRSVSKVQENWYNQLLDAGIDIIWANHAHIIKKQRLIKESGIRFPTKLVMCANGNTISGQRTSPNLNLKFTERDDTGDGLLYKIVLQKEPLSNKFYIREAERIFITMYINTAGEFVIRKLDDDFIDYLGENRPNWKDYIRARKEVCEGIEELHDEQVKN